jgi:hypothetical protein
LLERGWPVGYSAQVGVVREEEARRSTAATYISVKCAT